MSSETSRLFLNGKAESCKAEGLPQWDMFELGNVFAPICMSLTARSKLDRIHVSCSSRGVGLARACLAQALFKHETCGYVVSDAKLLSA